MKLNDDSYGTLGEIEKNGERGRMIEREINVSIQYGNTVLYS